jgi:class 3 adenylate cyclase
VNLASRIEGLTGKLGKFLLVSQELASVLALPTRSVGSFELKGVTAPQPVYELVDP